MTTKIKPKGKQTGTKAKAKGKVRKRAKPKPGRGPGQPAHKPTANQRDMVKTLTAFGIQQDLIAKKIKISVPTLEKHYRDELDFGMMDANAAVAGALFKTATNAKITGHVTAGIWWTKARMGWKETQVVENAVKGTIIVPATLPEDEWLKKWGGKAQEKTGDEQFEQVN